MDEKIKILHVEDNEDDAELVMRELKKAGMNFETVVTDNKTHYIKALTEFQPHVVLSDHTLPYFNSLEALTILREYDITAPFILVTGTVSEEFAVDMMKRGAADYLLKDRLQRLPRVIIKALERKKIETEHRAFLHDIITSEALMNDAQALAQFGSFDVNIATNTVKYSNLAYEIFGFTPGQGQARCSIVYSNKFKNVADAIRISIDEVFIDLMANKKSYTIISKSGRLKFLSAQFSMEKDAEGLVTKVKGLLLDVTKLKSAETLLQQSEANLKTIFETTDTGYVLCAPDGNIILFNKTAGILVEEQTGLPLRVGQPVSTYVTGERKNVVAEIIGKATAGESSVYETSLLSVNGEIKWYFFRWFPIMGDNNRQHGLMLAVSDITERKQLELAHEKIAADLVVRNNALEQFAYIVSHNLRAPVANITGITNLLDEWERLPKYDVGQFLTALKTSTTNLDSVVKDLNNILRMTHKSNEEKAVVYFQQMVEDVKTDLDALIKKTGAVMDCQFAESIYVHTIKSFLYCIFYNLILNSLQFKNDTRNPVIHISSRPVDHGCELRFTDNGRGIDLKKHGNKLFGLYQKLDSASGGKGMGLCIVKTMLNSLGGRIMVESVVEEGTTFIIYLPAEPPKV